MSYTIADPRESYQQSKGHRDGTLTSLAERSAFGESAAPIGLFMRCCRNLALRREKDGRDVWTIEEWRKWVERGRAAFGPARTALFGQLFLVEVMLESGCTAEQITEEVRARVAELDERDRLSRQRTDETNRRGRKQREEAEIEEQVRKKLLLMEADRRAKARAEEMGISTPGPSSYRRTPEWTSGV